MEGRREDIKNEAQRKKDKEREAPLELIFL